MLRPMYFNEKMKYHDLARSQRTNFLWRCKMHHMGLLHSTEWVETREQDKIHHLWVTSISMNSIQHVSFGKTAQQDQKCNQETFYTLFCKEKRMTWSPKVWYGASCSQFWIYYNIHFCLREHTCEQIPTKTLYTSQPSNRVQYITGYVQLMTWYK